VRIGGDYTLPAGEEVDEVVVIAGSARILGRVNGDVVVILGQLHLGGEASVGGDLVVVMGSGVVESGAQVERDFVAVGGDIDAPPDFVPGQDHVVIGPQIFGGRMDALVPWITEGMFWGRPIVPRLGWIWGIVGLFFLAYLALNALLDHPVQACAGVIAERPLSAFLVGLLTLLLIGPVLLLLAVSVIGIAVIPFLMCALLLAWIIGKVGLARAIGLAMLPAPEPGESPGPLPSRGRAALAFTTGFATLCVAYMIPFLGFVVWTIVGVVGLGAASLAFVAGYRRENPPTVRARPGAPVPPPVPTPSRASAHATAQTPAMAAPADGGPAMADAPGAALPPPVPEPPSVSNGLLAFPRGRFIERIAAFALDVILVMIAVQVLDIGRDGPRMFFMLLLAYHIGFWTWKGTTVGGIICQIRVVRTDGTLPSFADALVRGLSSILSLVVLGLGGLWILRDPERQAWHDKVAGTYVVKVPRNWPF
jgi:uncharacterized RDD family membrane protein YckC